MAMALHSYGASVDNWVRQTATDGITDVQHIDMYNSISLHAMVYYHMNIIYITVSIVTDGVNILLYTIRY